MFVFGAIYVFYYFVFEHLPTHSLAESLLGAIDNCMIVYLLGHSFTISFFFVHFLHLIIYTHRQQLLKSNRTLKKNVSSVKIQKGKEKEDI